MVAGRPFQTLRKMSCVISPLRFVTEQADGEPEDLFPEPLQKQLERSRQRWASISLRIPSSWLGSASMSSGSVDLARLFILLYTSPEAVRFQNNLVEEFFLETCQQRPKSERTEDAVFWRRNDETINNNIYARHSSRTHDSDRGHCHGHRHRHARTDPELP